MLTSPAAVLISGHIPDEALSVCTWVFDDNGEGHRSNIFSFHSPVSSVRGLGLRAAFYLFLYLFLCDQLTSGRPFFTTG